MTHRNPPPSTLYADRQAFEQLVQSLLAREDAGSFGKLHIVTISHGPDAPDWSRLEDKATRIAESILHARLSPQDACLRLESGQYMLLFPRLSEQEGAIRAAAIAREIKQRLFGEDHGGLDVTVQMMALARLKSRPAAGEVESMNKVLHTHAPPHGIHMDVVFQPVWSSVEQAVVANRARIHRRFHDQDLFEAAVFLGGEDDPLAPEVNRMLCQAAMRCGRTQGTLFVPQAINSHAMTDPAEISEGIGRLVRACGPGVVIELAGAVSTIAHSRLRQAIRAIRDAQARVAVRCVPEPEWARFLRDCGTDYLCLSGTQVRQAGLSTSAVLGLFTIFAHEVQGLGFQTCLWNASLSQEIKRAETLGYTLFSGPAVGANTAQPGAPHPLPAYLVYS